MTSSESDVIEKLKVNESSSEESDSMMGFKFHLMVLPLTGWFAASYKFGLKFKSKKVIMILPA